MCPSSRLTTKYWNLQLFVLHDDAICHSFSRVFPNVVNIELIKYRKIKTLCFSRYQISSLSFQKASKKFRVQTFRDTLKEIYLSGLRVKLPTVLC